MKNSFTRRLTVRVAWLVASTALLVLVAGGCLLNHQGMRAIEIMQRVEGEELVHLINELENPTHAQIKYRFEHEADSDIALYFVQVRGRHGDVIYRSANLGEAFIPPPPPRTASIGPRNSPEPGRFASRNLSPATGVSKLAVQ